MDHHHLPAGGGLHHAIVFLPQPQVQAPHAVSGRGGARGVGIADHDLRPYVPGDSRRTCGPGRRIGRGDSVDDQHHPRAGSAHQGRTSDGRRIARHHRGPSHRSHRRRRHFQHPAMACDFRHRDSGDSADLVAGRLAVHQTASSDRRGAPESAAVHGDRIVAMRSGDVPQPGRRGHRCRGRWRQCATFDRHRGHQPDRRPGFADVLRLVLEAFLLTVSVGYAIRWCCCI